MKGTIFCVLVLATVTLGRPETYTDKYDHIDWKVVCDNKQLLTAYIKCCLDLGKCTPEAKTLKSYISDALENDCAKCTDVQKEGSKYVIKHLVNNEPEYWTMLKAKYDPTGKYAAAHEKELREAKA